MKNKNDAFWLYPKTFLAETKDMTDEDTGVFTMLLIRQGEKGYLTERDFKDFEENEKTKISASVMDKFSSDDEGRYRSKNDRVIKRASANEY